MKPQNEQILKYLQKGRSLTTLKALDKFGCFRLSARIHELTNEGWAIQSEIVTLKSGKRIAKYSLLGKMNLQSGISDSLLRFSK